MNRYWTRAKIKEYYQKGDEWTRRMLKGLESSGRYPKDAVIRDGKRNVLADSRAVFDWIKVRKQFEAGDLLPAYRKGE